MDFDYGFGCIGLQPNFNPASSLGHLRRVEMQIQQHLLDKMHMFLETACRPGLNMDRAVSNVLVRPGQNDDFANGFAKIKNMGFCFNPLSPNLNEAFSQYGQSNLASVDPIWFVSVFLLLHRQIGACRPFGPTGVVPIDILISQQALEHKKGLTGLMPGSAVNDHLRFPTGN